MILDAICQDCCGVVARVGLDTDYVDLGSYSNVHRWCENELFEEHRHHFDIYSFKVINYESIFHGWLREQEERDYPLDEDDFIGYELDPISNEEIS